MDIKRTLNEEVNLHESNVQLHARNNAMIKKWAPVLNKCREIPKRKLGLVATLLENQLNNAHGGNNSGSMLFENTVTTGNIADFTRFSLPMIRKSYSKLIADGLVGMQALSQPVGMIFYIRYRYAMNKGQTVAGTQIMRQNTSNAYAKQNGWALDPYYSSQTVKDEALTLSVDTAGATITGTLAHRPILSGTVVVNLYTATTFNSIDSVPFLQVSFDSSGAVDVVSFPGESGVSNSITVDANNSDFTNGVVTLVTTGALLPTGALAKASYEYDLEASPFQPELTMSIDSDAVVATPRKLRTSWSLDASQDLKAVHNMDAESTLTDLMADEMVAEIDREIINDLIVAASIRATHNFATAAGGSVNFTDRNIALLYKTLEVANVIHRTTLRGPANWAVTSADIASKYEQLNDFKANDVMAEEGVEIGITKAGTIQSKLKLYKDPIFPNSKILLGFKGPSIMDSGYFYAPYIPLLSTPTVLDPNSYVPSKGIMTRYGKKLIEDGGLYYGTITVSNL